MVIARNGTFFLAQLCRSSRPKFEQGWASVLSLSIIVCRNEPLRRDNRGWYLADIHEGGGSIDLMLWYIGRREGRESLESRHLILLFT